MVVSSSLLIVNGLPRSAESSGLLSSPNLGGEFRDDRRGCSGVRGFRRGVPEAVEEG